MKNLNLNIKVSLIFSTIFVLIIFGLISLDRHTSAKHDNSVSFKYSLDKNSYSYGDKIVIKTSFTNNTGKDIVYSAPSSCDDGAPYYYLSKSLSYISEIEDNNKNLGKEPGGAKFLSCDDYVTIMTLKNGDSLNSNFSFRIKDESLITEKNSKIDSSLTIRFIDIENKISLPIFLEQII